MKRLSLTVIAVILLFQCGGGGSAFTPIKKPVSIALSETTTAYQGQLTRLAYIADQFTQSLVVLDTLQGKIVGTHDLEDFDYTPIPVGGEPSAVVIDDGSTPYRIYVADRLNKKIQAYAINPNFSGINDEFIPFKSVSLGGATEGISSRAIFKDAGAISSPTLTNLVVDPQLGKNEGWRLRSNGSGAYEVTGSASGIQKKNAVENKVYTTDDGAVQFFISAGGERTTDGDQFFFSTMITKPHALVSASSPVDMLINERKLYILTQEVPSIVVYDLDTLSEDGVFPLPDATAIPTKLSILNHKIFVSNIASGDIFSFNIDTQAIETISTSLPSIKYVGTFGTQLFLVQNADAKLSIADLAGTVQKTLTLNDVGSTFFAYKVGTKNVGFVPNISGNVDVIDLAGMKRIDTDLGDKTDFVNSQFYDTPPVSTPQLISVAGKATLVRDETWQMIFEGVLPNALYLPATISGNVVTAPTAMFGDSHVAVGDTVVVSGSNKELKVSALIDQTHLTLSTTPALQGSVTVSVRASGTYILTGSKSGTQEKRVTPGEAYSSDHDEITLRTRPSFNAPETRGDFFTFQTLDPIDPILINNQSIAVQGVALTRISDGNAIGYIIQQTNGQVSVVNLFDYGLEKTL